MKTAYNLCVVRSFYPHRVLNLNFCLESKKQKNAIQGRMERKKLNLFGPVVSIPSSFCFRSVPVLWQFAKHTHTAAMMGEQSRYSNPASNFISAINLNYLRNFLTDWRLGEGSRFSAPAAPPVSGSTPVKIFNFVAFEEQKKSFLPSPTSSLSSPESSRSFARTKNSNK